MAITWMGILLCAFCVCFSFGYSPGLASLSPEDALWCHSIAFAAVSVVLFVLTMQLHLLAKQVRDLRAELRAANLPQQPTSAPSDARR